MSYFEYRSLTPLETRFRLVHLLPENLQSLPPSSSEQRFGHALPKESSDLISCTIAHVSLSHAPEYAALSYTWGDPKQTVPMLMDGAIFMATINLEAALRRLRLPDKSLILWIDALCINQENNLEKNEQLEQMRQIYEQSSAVIAWLGPEADNSDVALQWLEEYGKRSFEQGIGNTTELRLQTLLKKHDRNEKDIVDEKLRDFLGDLKEELTPARLEQSGLYVGLVKLLRRSYWSRIWVVQELSSAAKLLFRCGESTMSDENFNHALRLLRNFAQYQNFKDDHNSHNVQSQAYQLLAINTGNPINLLKFRRTPGPFPIIQLLRSFRRFEATDPRDKLFALLGISRDAESLGLHPDYRKSCDEVYTGLSRTLIQHGYFEVLALCEFPKNIQNLHSWVLDWSLKPARSSLQQRSLNRSVHPVETFLEPPFSAAGITHQEMDLNPTDRDSKVPLFLRGILLGKVQETGLDWRPGAVGRWLLDLQRLSDLMPATSRISEEQTYQVWRTAVGDQELRQGPRKPRYLEEKIRTVHERLRGADMNVFDSMAFVQAGLGDYCEQLQIVAAARRPLLVSGGYLGIGPRETEPGDLVFILFGGNTPYILRQHAQDGTFQLIGEAYVHGVMDGERMQGDMAIETIALH